MDNSIYDRSDLRRVILSEGSQFAEGFAAVDAVSLSASAPVRTVVVSGMGGSALPGDLLQVILDAYGANITVHVNRSYTLPARIPHDALHFVCSHSGNTEETLSILHTLIEQGVQCIGVSSGGKLAQQCTDAGVPHIMLPLPFENFQPRMATGHFIAVFLGVLMRMGAISVESEAVLSAADAFAQTIPQQENAGRSLAAKLQSVTPLIYTTDALWPLARIWKIKINENAKTPAFWNVFPELNHNEYVGFTNPQAPFHIVMLTDAQDHPRNQKRFAITADTLAERGIDTTMVAVPEGDIITRLFGSLVLADWTSYALALAYEQDPTPVDMVEGFKALMEQ